MQTEVEVKFLRVDHDAVRGKLQVLGASCTHPNRLMRRTMLDDETGSLQKRRARLRIRDEGDKITVTYKQSQDHTRYHGETETTVGSYEAMQSLLESLGFRALSYQESKRETWQYTDCEIVLDEWPWLDTYIEIEGPSEPAIKQCADALGFVWEDAEYGSVDAAYRHQYPGMAKGETIGQVPRVCFGDPLPKFLEERQAA